MAIFWRCYYHFIWTTKNRAPLIMSPHHEAAIFEVIRQKTLEFDSQVLAINSMEEHIHVAVSLNPKVAISDWMKHVKGASSHEINEMFPNAQAHFQWQRGYGVLTFGAKAMELVLEYVNNQKQHHAQGTQQPYMERVEPDD